MIGNITQLFPKGLFLFFLIIVIGICICYLNKKDDRILLKIITFITFGLFSSFAIHVFSLSSFGAGRLHVSIGMTIGYLFLMLYVLTDIFREKKIISYCIKIILVVYVLINGFNFYYMTHEHHIINKLEKERVEEIAEYVDKYEEENNIKVNYIMMKHIKSNEKGYYKRKSAIDALALYSECSFDGIINFYTGKKLQRVQLTKDINSIYMQKINGEYKAICIGDVLVCPVYNV